MNLHMKVGLRTLGHRIFDVYGSSCLFAIFGTMPSNLRMLRGTTYDIHTSILHRRRLLGPFLYRFLNASYRSYR